MRATKSTSPIADKSAPTTAGTVKMTADGQAITPEKIKGWNESYARYGTPYQRAVSDAGEGVPCNCVTQPLPCGCQVTGNGTLQFPMTVRQCAMHIATPDLLTTLTALSGWCRTHTGPTDANSPHALLVAAHDAIAKATGEHPAPLSDAEAGDEAIVMQCAPSVRARRRIELAIVHRLIRDLTAAGYVVTADNGDGKTVAGASARQMIETLFSVDESFIHAEKNDVRSSVFLVFGNDGWDVISDYHTSLEPVMYPINEWIDAAQEKGEQP